jgi:hypothetical protein
MSKRNIVKVGGKKNFYAVRDKDGKFEDIANIGDSIHEDVRTHAKKKIKSGHGHEGDLAK